MSSDEGEIPRFTVSGTVVRYRGTLNLRDHGEAMDILFLEGEGNWDEPLAETISDDLDRFGRYASVRYWTADVPMGDEAIMESAVRAMLGEADARYKSAYSEITGYLWTDEDINVGGHDLLEELKTQTGRYCLLEISYSQAPVSDRIGWFA
jgi:hypothetical protein